MTCASRYRSQIATAILAVGIFIAGTLAAGPSIALAQEKAAAPPTTPSSPSFDILLEQGILRANISEPCKAMGKCEITDMIQIALNVMTFILGISGSVFLVMFVWGGFTWLTSGGAPGKISTGLETLRDATEGLIVVFGAYTLVNTTLSLIRTGTLPTTDLNTNVNQLTPIKTIEIKSQ